MNRKRALCRLFIVNLAIWTILHLNSSVAVGQEPNKPSESPKLSPKEVERFESDVRPLLVKYCYECHSAEAGIAEGGLQVDTRDGIRRGGDSGPAVVPGDLKKSLLVLAIRYTNEDIAMPPKESGGKMSEKDIATLEKWIKAGAPDPRDGTALSHEGYDYSEAKQWWAFQPITKPTPPATNDSSWAYSDIDRFVQAKFEEKGLHPVADAKPETLLRRIHFDLTGLPPSPGDVANFLAQANTGGGLQKAIEKEVDRLLQSDQFGMHWGRHWLDVARFAESSGRDVNATYPHAWRYRNYVINALNDDVPYDQFLREQIAGDLLPAKTDEELARRQIATGFLAIGSKSLNEMNPRQFAVDMADEQIDAVFQATMGLTVGCARCHDHKFDPIPQRDYTAIAGIFLSTQTHFGSSGGRQGRNNTPLLTLPEDIGLTTPRSNLTQQQMRAMRAEVEQAEKELERLAVERREQRRKGQEPKQDAGNFLRLTARVSAIETELANYDEQGKPRAMAMGVADKTGESSRFVSRPGRNNRPSGFDSIANAPFFIRGDVDMPSERVPRGLLTMFESSQSIKMPQSQSGRLELANWIVSSENTMTSRVAANRIWYWMFGQGLVASADNFGTTGSLPSNPELLDFLATKFREQGWSTKQLVREIVLSHTYQLSTNYDDENFKIDPDNVYSWRAQQRRLPAESIRDAILAASGKLDKSPQQGSLISRNVVSVLGQGRAGVTEEQIVRDSSKIRSVYLPLPRGIAPEVLETFDMVDASAVQTVREATNVPSQSLFLLNSEFVADQSRKLAARLVEKFPGETFDKFDERIELAYLLIYGRKPQAEEQRVARRLLTENRENAKTAWASVARGLFASAEFRYLD
jgi:Protein of unknown function (DUF1553)/Protein of unknown function (DUF1549)/Planctomycete cytochrome C